MLLTVCVVTRNKSIAVSTLHMLLNVTSAAYTRNDDIQIHYVEDTRALNKLLKTGEKILWVDYGCSLERDSFDTLFSTKYEVLVFTAVKDGVDWNLFKCRLNSTEPLEQKALEFDTVVDNKIKDYFWTIKSTDSPVCFVMDCKSVEKKLRGKKGEVLKVPRDVVGLFEKFVENKVQCVAYTLANVIVQRQYECIGNIMESAYIQCVRN